MPQHRITLRLTPMVRWMMSFGHEVEEFPKAFNFDLLPQLSERFKVAEERVSTQSQALLKIDLLLLIALALPNLEGIEVFGTPLAKFSFLAEALLLASAISFFFLVGNFTTARCYEAMVMAVCSRHVPDPRWNGRYLAASFIDQHLVIHVTSHKLNAGVSAPERWIANENMIWVTRLFSWSVYLALLPLLALHLGVTTWAVIALLLIGNVGVPLDGAISVFAAVVNLAAIAIFISINEMKREFDAPVLGPEQQRK